MIPDDGASVILQILLDGAVDAEIVEFLQQHLACYVNLFRTELQHLEDGHYKFPYDLNPAGRSSNIET
jgi:hypothetical protein